MIQPIKRTWENLEYTILCAPLLDPGEYITSVASVSADEGAMIFSSPVINPSTYVLDDGTNVPANTAIQFRASGGLIPAGYQNLQCIIRARFYTSASPTAREATVYIILQDTP